MFSMAPNIVLVPNMTQNAEHKHCSYPASSGLYLRGEGSAPRGVRQTPPWCKPSLRLPTGRGLGRPPPPNTLDTTGYCQQADSMHPTGMYSCFISISANLPNHLMLFLFNWAFNTLQTSLATWMNWTESNPGYQGRTSGAVCGQDPRSVHWFH